MHDKTTTRTTTNEITIAAVSTRYALYLVIRCVDKATVFRHVWNNCSWKWTPEGLTNNLANIGYKHNRPGRKHSIPSLIIIHQSHYWSQFWTVYNINDFIKIICLWLKCCQVKVELKMKCGVTFLISHVRSVVIWCFIDVHVTGAWSKKTRFWIIDSHCGERNCWLTFKNIPAFYMLAHCHGFLDLWLQ